MLKDPSNYFSSLLWNIMRKPPALGSPAGALLRSSVISQRVTLAAEVDSETSRPCSKQIVHSSSHPALETFTYLWVSGRALPPHKLLASGPLSSGLLPRVDHMALAISRLLAPMRCPGRESSSGDADFSHAWAEGGRTALHSSENDGRFPATATGVAN